MPKTSCFQQTIHGRLRSRLGQGHRLHQHRQVVGVNHGAPPVLANNELTHHRTVQMTVTSSTQSTTRERKTVEEEDHLMAAATEDPAEEVATTNQGTTGVANQVDQEGPVGLATMTMIRVAMAARKVGPKVRDLTPWPEQLLGMTLRR